MSISRLSLTLIIAVFLLLSVVDHALASTHIWITIEPPQVIPTLGSTFTTDLKISSWNGAGGAIDFTVLYDPNVLQIIDFTVPSTSPFYPDCFTTPGSLTEGITRIACFQVISNEQWEDPLTFATLTWKVIGIRGPITNLEIQQASVVDFSWQPTEVSLFGKGIAIEVKQVYLPLIYKNK